MTPRRIDPHARHAAPARLPEDTLHAAPPDEHPTLERVWELLDAAGPATDDTASTDQAWAALADRLALDPGLATQTPRPAARQARTRSASREPFRGARSPRRRWATATLGLAALLLLVLAWPRTVTHTVPFGEQRAVTLPDGSTAHLNSGATLAYARGFDRLPLVAAPTRQVRLDGEAFFDVTPATEHGGRAFVVETFNAQVEVVGTRFNVRAWHSQEERTTVTVEEGIVNVTGSNATGSDVEAIRLEAGHEAIIAPGVAVVADEAAAPEQATAWRRDGLAFRDLPLTHVLAELERRYAVQLRLDAAASGGINAAALVYYQPSPGPITEVLDDLGRLSGFQYRAVSDGYVLFARAD